MCRWLERCRRSLQLQHAEDAGRGRPRRDQVGHREAGKDASSPHSALRRELRPRQPAPPYRWLIYYSQITKKTNLCNNAIASVWFQVYTRPLVTTSSSRESLIAALRSASRVSVRRRAAAISRTGARRPTATRTPSPSRSCALCASTTWPKRRSLSAASRSGSRCPRTYDTMLLAAHHLRFHTEC